MFEMHIAGGWFWAWSLVLEYKPNEKKDKTDSGVGALLPPDEIGASERELMKQSKGRFVKWEEILANNHISATYVLC